ncbi:MAG: haloalkane dehalogenase [Candidatus Omnitrophica bacterium ADurb.Bin277]|nr:MAG: haloalkane dehalogenase [Candidatus Omnitrophica bacterium ADurb.Bin277]
MPKTVFLAALGTAVVFFLFRFLEFRSVYFPAKQIMFLPSAAGLPFEDVFFTSSDQKRLHGWFIPASGDGDTVLFCHGNAGNISHRLGKAVFLNRLGLNVFMFDYRGYGKSRGRPSENGFYRDAQAAYDYLVGRGIPAGKVIGYGESIGGAVAVDLAVSRPMKALILENTFTNIKDMVAIHMPFVPSRILASRYDSIQKIKGLKIPKLIIQSRRDEIVPFEMGRTLFEAGAPPREFLEIRGDHNNGFFESEDLIEEKLKEFFAAEGA